MTEQIAAQPVLSVRNLRVAYGHGRVHVAVSDVSFDIGRGEVVALVGESGSGKSTTAQAIIGLLGAARIESGTIEFLGQEVQNLPERQYDALRGGSIGFVPQDPSSSLNPLVRIGKQIAETLVIHGKANWRDARTAALGIIERAGLTQPELRARQYPHELSGGMRQRVLIGIAMACEPALIVADEPTSALDVTVQKRILDHLDDVIARTGVSVLLITHDLGVAADRADRIIVLSGGEIVEAGPSKQILESPKHPYTRKLIAAAPSLSAARMAPATSRQRTPEDAAAPLVAVEHLTKRYKAHGSHEEFVAVDGVSFRIDPGTTFSIVGESGSGKSTTARMVMRLVEPSDGTIRFEGNDITHVKGGALRSLRERIQIVYQNPFTSLDPRFSVASLIDEPMRAFGMTDRAARVSELIEVVGLTAATAMRRAAELSGGQRQRVAIARALALRPRLMILDEPVSALDVSIQERVLQLLVDLQGEFGLSYLFISHDLAVVRQVSDVVSVMQAGRMIEVGPSAQVLCDPVEAHTRELLEAIPGRA